METRRKIAMAHKARQQSTQYVKYESCSDSESVATQMAFEEDPDDSDYDVRTEKVGQTYRKRLPLQGHSHHSGRNSTATTAVGVTRQPTRRPDPNVSNRNALMARENRKRKKELQEQLEHENGNLQRDLQKLQKVVERQEVMIRGLRNERNHLKSVLENQSDIVTLLKRLQPGREEADNQRQAHPSQRNNTLSGASPNSIYSDSGMSLCGDLSPLHDARDAQEQQREPSEVFDNDGTEEFNLFDETLLNDAFPLISTDLMFSADPFVASGGNDLFSYDLPDAEDGEGAEKSALNGNVREETIRSEHNYVYPDVSLIPHDNNHAVVVVKNPTAEEQPEDNRYYETKRPRMSQVEGDEDATATKSRHSPGICLHIGGGKVSIEFCAQCHQSATKEWQFSRL